MARKSAHPERNIHGGLEHKLLEPPAMVKLTPHDHKEITSALGVGEHDKLDPRKLIQFSKGGNSSLHSRAGELAVQLKVEQYRDIIKSIPPKNRKGLEKTFKQFMEEHYSLKEKKPMHDPSVA